MEIDAHPRRWWHWLRSPQFCITAGFGLAFYFLIRAFEGAPIPSWPYRPMMGQSAFLLICIGMMGAMWWLHGRQWAYYLLVHMFAFGFGAATLLVWQSMPIGPGAVGSDAWFNTAIVTKHRYGMGNGDFAYKGLHTFYPSLYQWMVGKLGALTVTPAHKAMKYGFYWVAFLLPLASYGLWRKILPKLPAFLLVVVAMTLCRINLAFKTYEVISLILFIPWALRYVAGVRLTETDGVATWEIQHLQRRDWIIGGTIAGLCFMTFYYYFFLMITWLPLLAVVELKTASWRSLWDKFRPMAYLFLLMLAVSAVFWVPLIGDMARFGMHSYQNRWFQPHMLGLPFDLMDNWKGILALGILLVLAPSNKLARAIVVMLIALLAYVLLGHMGIYRNFPLLHVRMVGMETHLLHVGLVLGLLQLLARFKEFIQQGWDKALAIAVATVYAINITMNYNYESSNELAKAAERFVPPPLVSFPEFNQMAKGKIFLTNRLDLVAMRPLYLFICPNAHYSHPSAQYRDRLKLLTLLQGSRDSDFIAWMLQYNRYNRVDFVLLDGNRLEIFDDNFPYWPNHNQVSVQFDSTAFRGQYFAQDTMFTEIFATEEVPQDLWQQFDQGELRLAALFSDIPEIDTQIPPAELQALQDEIRIQTRDYKVWKNVFWSRWMQVED